MSKRTFGGSRLKAVKVVGFRARMKTKTGRQILSKRRQKGRKLLALALSRKS